MQFESRLEERGQIKGRAEGRAEGRVEGILDSVRNLMASIGWPAERAMDALRLSDDDRAKCAGSRISKTLP